MEHKWRKLFSYYKPYKWLFISDMFFAVIGAAVTLVIPLIVRYITSRGKGFAIGSAALTALALIASYIDKVIQIAPDYKLNLAITNPTVLIGLFIGGMLPFLFAALTMSAVGTAAQSIVLEVRRQFQSIVGLREGKAEPREIRGKIC